VKIKLTYPIKSHELRDLRPLYEEFRAEDVERFRAWCEIERKGKNLEPDDLKEIQYAIIDFLGKRTEWDSHAALVSAFADFRRLLAKDIFWS